MSAAPKCTNIINILNIIYDFADVVLFYCNFNVVNFTSYWQIYYTVPRTLFEGFWINYNIIGIHLCIIVSDQNYRAYSGT